MIGAIDNHASLFTGLLLSSVKESKPYESPTADDVGKKNIAIKVRLLNSKH